MQSKRMVLAYLVVLAGVATVHAAPSPQQDMSMVSNVLTLLGKTGGSSETITTNPGAIDQILGLMKMAKDFSSKTEDTETKASAAQPEEGGPNGAAGLDVDNLLTKLPAAMSVVGDSTTTMTDKFFGLVKIMTQSDSSAKPLVDGEETTDRSIPPKQLKPVDDSMYEAGLLDEMPVDESIYESDLQDGMSIDDNAEKKRTRAEAELDEEDYPKTPKRKTVAELVESDEDPTMVEDAPKQANKVGLDKTRSLSKPDSPVEQEPLLDDEAEETATSSLTEDEPAPAAEGTAVPTKTTKDEVKSISAGAEKVEATA
ncbi:hypothetical protein H4R33_005446 [Dimargaris cristalligena]|nr:hypothetical protein H4R33_005446 [Dimargaris cristalligena]